MCFLKGQTMPLDEQKQYENNTRDYHVHYVSFERTGTGAFTMVCFGRGEKPSRWHIDKLRAIVDAYDNGEYEDELDEDDYSDIC